MKATQICHYSAKTHVCTVAALKDIFSHLPKAEQSCTFHLIPFIAQRKRLSCHRCSRRGQQSKCFFFFLLLSLRRLLTLLTLSFLLPFYLSLSLHTCSLIRLFPPVRRLHNAHQLFRGSLPVSPTCPIRAGLCTNGLLLYTCCRLRHTPETVGGMEGN